MARFTTMSECKNRPSPVAGGSSEPSEPPPGNSHVCYTLIHSLCCEYLGQYVKYFCPILVETIQGSLDQACVWSQLPRYSNSSRT